VGGRDMLLEHSKSLTYERKHAVIRPGISRLCIAGCAALLGYCSMLLIVRSSGPETYGSYFLVLWLASVATPAVGIGISTLTSRHIIEIQSRESPRSAAGVFYFVWQRQYRKILLYCLAYLLLVIPFSWFFGGNAPGLLLLLAGLSIPPLLLSGVASIALRSLHRYNLLTAIRFAGALIFLLLVILAMHIAGQGTGIVVTVHRATAGPALIGVQHRRGLSLAAAFLLATTAAGLFMLTIALLCIVRLLPLREALSPGTFLKNRLTRGLSNSLLLFILDGIIWQPGELILLGHWRSAADLGFYALSSGISTGVMNIVPTLLSTCILPLLLRYVPGQHYINAADAWIKTTRYTTLLTLPICATAIIFCPTMIVFCFGTAFLPAVTPLRILLIPAAVGSVATISMTYLASSDRKHTLIRYNTAAAILNVGLAFPCIALWGVTGAALASAVAQIISATGIILLCRRYILVAVSSKFAVPSKRIVKESTS
jgi:O-antigen/teichoic acid export membrane protein